MGIGQKIGEELRDFINPPKRMANTITRTYTLTYDELAKALKISEPIAGITIDENEKKIRITTIK